MEYAKDVVLDMKNGTDVKNDTEWKYAKKRFFGRGVFRKLEGRKILLSILVVTLAFMVIDMILISSFIGVLGTV